MILAGIFNPCYLYETDPVKKETTSHLFETYLCQRAKQILLGMGGQPSIFIELLLLQWHVIVCIVLHHQQQ